MSGGASSSAPVDSLPKFMQDMSYRYINDKEQELIDNLKTFEDSEFVKQMKGCADKSRNCQAILSTYVQTMKDVKQITSTVVAKTSVNCEKAAKNGNLKNWTLNGDIICYLCGCTITQDQVMECDHIISVAFMGGIHPDTMNKNFAWTHSVCNKFKLDKSASEVMELIQEDAFFTKLNTDENNRKLTKEEILDFYKLRIKELIDSALENIKINPIRIHTIIENMNRELDEKKLTNNRNFIENDLLSVASYRISNSKMFTGKMSLSYYSLEKLFNLWKYFDIQGENYDIKLWYINCWKPRIYSDYQIVDIHDTFDDKVGTNARNYIAGKTNSDLANKLYMTGIGAIAEAVPKAETIRDFEERYISCKNYPIACFQMFIFGIYIDFSEHEAISLIYTALKKDTKLSAKHSATYTLYNIKSVTIRGGKVADFIDTNGNTRQVDSTGNLDKKTLRAIASTVAKLSRENARAHMRPQKDLLEQGRAENGRSRSRSRSPPGGSATVWRPEFPLASDGGQSRPRFGKYNSKNAKLRVLAKSLGLKYKTVPIQTLRQRLLKLRGFAIRYKLKLNKSIVNNVKKIIKTQKFAKTLNIRITKKVRGKRIYKTLKELTKHIKTKKASELKKLKGKDKKSGRVKKAKR